MSILRSVLRSSTRGVLRSALGRGNETVVFVLAGQSNAVGRAAFDSGDDFPAGVLQYNQSNALVAASEPLDHIDETAGKMGMFSQFAIEWCAANPGKNLVLVPCAKGSTGFATGDWTHDGTNNLYDDMVSRANALFAANPSYTLGGLLWHQGENDTGNASYETQLDAMFGAFRSDVIAAGPTTPIVVGGFLDQWVAASANNATIAAIVADTPNRVGNLAYAHGQNLANLDSVHFGSQGLRAMGSRYYVSLQDAIANTDTAPLKSAAYAMAHEHEWVMDDAGMTLSDNVLHFDNTANGMRAVYWGYPFAIGRTYEIKVTISNRTGGTFFPRHPFIGTPYATANGQFTWSGAAVDKFFALRGDGGSSTADIVIDSITDVTP